MVDVMFFSYRSTDAWWQYLARKLDFTASTCVVSDIRGDGTLNIVDDFYNNLQENNCIDIATEQFSNDVCDDIIRRCRVLRNLAKPKSLGMIGAMWLTLNELIINQQPRLVMSFIIDRYVLDVLDRVLQSHGIPFLGMTASIIPNQVMFMDRGTLIPVRTPLLDDIALARTQIVNDTFTPSYVSTVNKYNRRRYWKTFLAFKLRGIMYQGLRHIKRDPLNLHYLDALNHLEHKPRWSDYVVLNAINHDWESMLLSTAYNKRVFIGLQLLPEASLDYWLKDTSLLNNEKITLEICEILSQAGFTIFVKDHPLQFGFRKKDLIQKLASMPNVVLIPYSAPATRLIKECAITVTMTGTIGFQSAVAGACSIVSGAYYSDDKHFIQMRHQDDIKTLPEKIINFQQTHAKPITPEGIDGLLSNILAASAPGDLFSFKKFNENKLSDKQSTKTLIHSLNLYLPQFLKDNKNACIIN